MQRISFRITVAVLTFIIGLASVFFWRGLISNFNQTPANTTSIQIESSPITEKYCEVHAVPMFKEHVPSRWGYSPYSSYELWQGHMKAHRTLFPNTNPYVWGGCVRNESISDEVYVCPQCRVAEAERIQQTSRQGK